MQSFSKALQYMVISDALQGPIIKTGFHRFLVGAINLANLTYFHLHQKLPDSPSGLILTWSHLRAAK